MGNIIIANSFVTDGTFTPASTATGYAAANVFTLDRLMLRHRANTFITNGSYGVIDFGAAQVVDAIQLCRVNFDHVQILGNATDSWGSPSFDSGSLTIGQNKITKRYDIRYLPTSFNYRYMNIWIPSGASAVGDYTAKTECSTIGILESADPLSVNMTFGYQRHGTQFVNKKEFGHGGLDITKLGDNIRWEGQIAIGNRELSDEAEIWTASALDQSLPIWFCENGCIDATDTADGYICYMDQNYSGIVAGPNYVNGGMFRFLEFV